jgi:spore coat protein U-like protein
MKLTKLFLFLASISALVISSDGAAVAASPATANLGVSVNVKNNCTITTIAVGFPDYDPIVANASTPDDSTSGSVTITCTKGGGSSIALGYGLQPSPATQPRMTNGTDFLNYSLYSDNAGGTLWSGVTRTIAGAANQSAQLFPVYGRIPAAQLVSSGTYNDTVVATVNF